MKCDLLLECSHTCSQICHVKDREHKDYLCKQKCVKSCPNDHQCNLLCHEPCKPCMIKVERNLKCGHSILLACSIDPDSYNCRTKVLKKK